MAPHAQCECGSFQIAVDGEPIFWGLCSSSAVRDARVVSSGLPQSLLKIA